MNSSEDDTEMKINDSKHDRKFVLNKSNSNTTDSEDDTRNTLYCYNTKPHSNNE